MKVTKRFLLTLAAVIGMMGVWAEVNDTGDEVPAHRGTPCDVLTKCRATRAVMTINVDSDVDYKKWMSVG